MPFHEHSRHSPLHPEGSHFTTGTPLHECATTDFLLGTGPVTARLLMSPVSSAMPAACAPCHTHINHSAQNWPPLPFLSLEAWPHCPSGGVALRSLPGPGGVALLPFRKLAHHTVKCCQSPVPHQPLPETIPFSPTGRHITLTAGNKLTTGGKGA